MKVLSPGLYIHFFPLCAIPPKDALSFLPFSLAQYDHGLLDDFIDALPPKDALSFLPSLVDQ